jgi:hypothetical protein
MVYGNEFSFWDFLWTTIWVFFFIAFLMMLFSLFADIFRDQELSGWGKTGWCILLIFLPILGSLIYLIVRGKGMARRQGREMAEYRARQDEYIRSVASTSSPTSSPADQLAQAKALLDSGAITQQEYATVKAKVLA